MILAIIGLIVGFLLGKIIFRKTYRGPSSNSVKEKVFKKDNKCYRLEPIPYVCPTHYRHI